MARVVDLAAEHVHHARIDVARQRQPGAQLGRITIVNVGREAQFVDNTGWRTLCTRGRALREQAGTLTGHAAGDDSRHTIDQSAVTKALGNAVGREGEPGELPEPLASVLDYLGEGLDTRDFVPTAELVDALDVEPTPFGRQMGELGCQPHRGRITTEDGTQRQARGYTTADLRAAAEEHCTNEPSTGTGSDS